MRSNVFIALQDNEDARPIIEAIEQDNPLASIDRQPAMVRIEAPGRLVIRRASVEARVGRDWDLQEIHLNVISLSGNLDEDDDEITLSWND